MSWVYMGIHAFIRNNSGFLKMHHKQLPLMFVALLKNFKLVIIKILHKSTKNLGVLRWFFSPGGMSKHILYVLPYFHDQIITFRAFFHPKEHLTSGLVFQGEKQKSYTSPLLFFSAPHGGNKHMFSHITWSQVTSS